MAGKFTTNPYGWEEVSVEESTAGDIVVWYYGSVHHVAIIADYGTATHWRVYDCGSNTKIQSAGTEDFPESYLGSYSKSSATHIYRIN